MLAVALAALALAAPPSSGVDVFGQPDRAQESLHPALAIFARAPSRPALLPDAMASLTNTVTHLSGNPGLLQLGFVTKVATPLGPIYLAPTTHRWICVQGPTFATCHPGLLPGRVTWNLYSAGNGITFVGIADDDVTHVTLRWGTHSRPAELKGNVFVVSRPAKLTSPAKLPPLGSFQVTYRDRPTAVVRIH